MTEQKKRITESSEFLRTMSPFSRIPALGLATYLNPSFLKEFKILKRVNYLDIPPELTSGNGKLQGEVVFASYKNVNFIVLNGHINYFDGYSMRESAHGIYTLRSLGVKKVLLIDEVGHLNPRFKTGGTALIYDHINLMGNNPLIGENDGTLGPRFPDMSNAYDEKWTSDIEKLLIEKKYKYYPSVYIGLTGPETETEAECRFYRDVGSDVLGYALVPENIAAVHCGISCAAIGMITRELVPDRLAEITAEEKQKNRLKAEKSFGPILKEIIAISK